MAWPANIAPQTPSTIYDPVNVSSVVSPAVPPPIFVWMRGGAYFTVLGARSRCRIDMPLYDRSTTRDQVNASMLGRGGVSIIKVTSSGTVASPVTTSLNGDLEVLDGSVTATITAQPDEILTMNQQDDNFAHIPPHQNVVGQSLIRWFDGPLVTNAPSGNCVGECVGSTYITSGPGIPQNIGCAPPNYTTPS